MGHKYINNIMQIPYLPLDRINAAFEPQLSQAVADAVRSGRYLRGERVARFEEEFARYCGARHAVACANGLDALTLVLAAWKETHGWADGDEVAVPALTFAATGLAVVRAGLRPVWVDVGEDALIDAESLARALSPRTRAVIAVHLYGRVCNMEALRDLQARHGFLILEDAAQAHGATRHGRRAGNLGDAAAFSFYPGKNLGALGDAGMVLTDDDALSATVRTLANYGARTKYDHVLPGLNSRMDEIQAAALSVKLPRLDDDNRRRAEIAAQYRSCINAAQSPTLSLLPPEPVGTASANHIFPVFSPRRAELQAHLGRFGVETLVHYPTPLHLLPAFAPAKSAFPALQRVPLPVAERLAATELSLPLHPLLTDANVDRICQAVRDFR